METVTSRAVTFGAELHALRTAAGVSQRELAEQLRERGHPVRTGAAIGGWERDEYQPASRELIADLEGILGAEPGHLVALSKFTGGSDGDVGSRLRRLEEWQAQAVGAEPDIDRHRLDLLAREFAAFRADVSSRLDAIEGALFGPSIHAQAAHGGKPGEVIEDHGPARGRVGTFDPDEEE